MEPQNLLNLFNFYQVNERERLGKGSGGGLELLGTTGWVWRSFEKLRINVDELSMTDQKSCFRPIKTWRHPGIFSSRFEMRDDADCK